MRNILVLGSSGMTGHIVTDYLKTNNKREVIGVSRTNSPYTDREMDVSDFGELSSYLGEINPDIVINCVGILIKQSEEDISTAIQINSLLPHILADLGEKMDFKLIHLSTDCVFSGKEGNYPADAFRDGDTPYARTKALGELDNDRDLTIRTSIIGPELKKDGTGLLDWFLKQEGKISGYTNVYWSGVTTLELAKAIHTLIEKNITGLYQLSSPNKISKYDLLKLCAQIWHKDIVIDPDDKYFSDKSLVPSLEKFNYCVSEYPEMLKQCYDWMKAHKEYYPHYMG